MHPGPGHFRRRMARFPHELPSFTHCLTLDLAVPETEVTHNLWYYLKVYDCPLSAHGPDRFPCLRFSPGYRKSGQFTSRLARRWAYGIE